MMTNTQQSGRNRESFADLGALSAAAGVDLGLAQEAEAAGLLRPDSRGGYRPRSAAWLAKLSALREGGFDWGDIVAWTTRRWEDDHPDERRWPKGFTGRRPPDL